VLLSSHLLNEVELIADEMILIGRGEIVARGDKKTLLAGAAQGAASTFATALDNAALASALEAKGLTVASVGDGLRVEAEAVEVGRTALESGQVLIELRAAEGGLEDLFLELTSDTQREHL
jgi:ABC-2 type transport system ATP-binding protein